MLFGGDDVIEKRKAKCRQYANRRNKEGNHKVRNFIKRKRSDITWFERKYKKKPNGCYLKYPVMHMMHPFYIGRKTINKLSFGGFIFLFFCFIFFIYF